MCSTHVQVTDLLFPKDTEAVQFYEDILVLVIYPKTGVTLGASVLVLRGSKSVVGTSVLLHQDVISTRYISNIL